MTVKANVFRSFDACVDHKAPGFAERLAAPCAEGVDVYFENVGGKVLDAIIPLRLRVMA